MAPAGWEEPETRELRPAAKQPPFSNMAATGVRDVPFPSMAAKTGGHPREGSAPSQHGGNLGQLPAPSPRIVVPEARAARFPQEQASCGHVTRRRRPVIGRVLMTSDAAAPRARARARSEPRDRDSTEER